MLLKIVCHWRVYEIDFIRLVSFRSQTNYVFVWNDGFCKQRVHARTLETLSFVRKTPRWNDEIVETGAMTERMHELKKMKMNFWINWQLNLVLLLCFSDGISEWFFYSATERHPNNHIFIAKMIFTISYCAVSSSSSTTEVNSLGIYNQIVTSMKPCMSVWILVKNLRFYLCYISSCFQLLGFFLHFIISFTAIIFEWPILANSVIHCL